MFSRYTFTQLHSILFKQIKIHHEMLAHGLSGSLQQVARSDLTQTMHFTISKFVEAAFLVFQFAFLNETNLVLIVVNCDYRKLSASDHS